MSYWEECMYDWHGGPPSEPRPPTEVVAKKTFETEKAILFDLGDSQFWAPKQAVIAIEGDRVLLCDWFKARHLLKPKLRGAKR